MAAGRSWVGFPKARYSFNRYCTFRTLIPRILHGNTPMRRVCTDLGFSFEGETRAFKDVR